MSGEAIAALVPDGENGTDRSRETAAGEGPSFQGRSRDSY